MTAGFSYDCSSPQLKKAIDETNGKCPTREVMKYLAKEPLHRNIDLKMAKQLILAIPILCHQCKNKLFSYSSVLS